MRKIRRTKTTYVCGTCGTEHGRKTDAEACEAAGVEEKKFRVGEQVSARERRCCPNGHEYVASGPIKRIVGPEPYDAEVHGKGFGLWKSPGHLYMYEIVACCGTCRSRVSVRYPAMALTRRRRHKAS